MRVGAGGPREVHVHDEIDGPEVDTPVHAVLWWEEGGEGRRCAMWDKNLGQGVRREPGPRLGPWTAWGGSETRNRPSPLLPTPGARASRDLALFQARPP